ncbi:hypothetical protein BDV06DRAFT_183086 [Aspergillus oleicola]
MDTEVRAERKSRRQQLVDTYHALANFHPCLSPADLLSIGIQQIPMTLEGDNCPKFFAAYGAAVQKPRVCSLDPYSSFENRPFYDAQALAAYLTQYFNHCVLPERASNPAGVAYSDWGNFGFGDLVDLTRGSRWQVKTTWHMPKSESPHIVVSMFSEMAEGDALFHGEIKTAIRIMYRRLKTALLLPHVIAPVLLFSAIGDKHLRVIEAYHDGDHLVMRTTPLFDLSKPDEDLFIRLTRWGLGGPSTESTTLA